MLTSEQKSVAVAAMIAAIKSEPMTTSDLAIRASRALNVPVRAGDYSVSRIADRWLQKERKAGRAHFVRIGRLTTWSLTDTGKAAYGAHQQEPARIG